jgi:myosin protein heavy chain
VELLEDALRKCPKQSNIDALEVDFQRQIDVYEKLNDESMNLNNQLREEVEKCNQDVAELMAKLANVQKQERNMEGKFQQEIDSLTFELDAAKSNISNLQEKLEILFKEREAIEISSNDAMLQLDALVIIKTKLESEIKDINAKCIEANQTICQNDELIKSLESKLEAIELEHAENNLRMDEIIKGQKSKEQEIIDEKFKLSTLENEKKMLELRISEKDNKMSNLKEENDSLYRNICKLQEQAQTLIKENANLKINIDKSQSDMELSSELEFRLSKTEADRNLLQLENSRIQQQLHIWEEDAKIWKIEKEKLSEMLKRANEQKLELEERLLSSVNANDFNILKSQNEEKITFLESKLFDAEERFNALQKSTVSNAKEILLRIELEKSKESFQKEKRLLQLRISELEEYCNRYIIDQV